MTDQSAVLAALVEIAQVERSGAFLPVMFSLGPYTAFTMVSLLQLTWRHPELSDNHRQVIETIARPVQVMFAGTVLGEALEDGWDLTKDVYRPRRGSDGDAAGSGGE